MHDLLLPYFLIRKETALHRSKVIVLIFLLILPASFSVLAQQLAFPSASGAGAFVSGGRGKPVYIVTNLNDSGPGSFRQCLENTRDTDGGIITFAVSGTINLSSQIYFSHQDNITIAGQTAPEGGITVANYTFRLRNVNNLILRYIRFRPDQAPYPSSEVDSFQIFDSQNYIIDHCSISWGTDENADSGIGNTYTWQRNLIAESNKTGMIMGAQVEQSFDQSFLNNMFYNCSHRFPNWQSDGRVDVINNVVWNFRTRIGVNQGGFEANQINNYYVYFRNDPPADLTRWNHWYPFNQTYGGNTLSEYPTIYTSGNYISDVLTDPNADNWFTWRFRLNPVGSPYQGAGDYGQLTTDFKTTTPFPQLGNSMPIQSAIDAFNDVKYNVGANSRLDENGNAVEEIDGPDSIYLSNVQNNVRVDYTPETNLSTAHFNAFQASVSSTPINTGYPDSNSDGIPDAWKLSKGFAVDANLTTFVWPSGYVGIEEFLNGVDGEQTPQVNAGADQSICLGESASLTATGADTYLWDTIPVQTTANITVTPDVTTTYTVTGTDAGGNISTDSITVFVTPLPVANAGDDASICDGETITLTASGGSSYEWSTGQTTQSISVSPNSDTTYSVIVTQNNCQDSDEVIVTVNPSPNANAGNDVTINEGESTTLTAIGGDTYLWNTGETTQSINVSPIIDTTYTVTVSQNGCEDSDSVIVFVNTAVNANAGQDQTICEGESTQLTASGGDTYLWNTGETTATITVSPIITTTYSVTVSIGNNSDSDDVIVNVDPTPTANAGQDVTINEGESTTLTASGGDSYLWNTGETTQSISVSPITDTTYSVTVFQNTCEDSDSVNVFVNASVVANAGEDQSICEGESTTLTASGGDTYLWNTGETTASITVSPTITTTYSVTVSDANSSDSDEVIVNVNPIPIANAGNDAFIDLGQSATLTASGGDSYLWSTGETTQSITVSPTESTTYSVTVSLNGCTDSDDVNVIVNNVMANAGQDQDICIGESTVLTATGGDTYLWNTGETTASITVSPSTTTTYIVTVTTSDGSDSDDVTVTVNAIPIAEAGPNQTICEGETITLIASGGTTYLWSNGQTTQSIQVTPMTTSNYTVTVDQNGCTDEDSVTVTVNEVPIAYAGENVIINEGESTTLTASGGDTYEWSTGETTQSIEVAPTLETIYTVFVTQNGCEDFADVTVSVNAAANANAGEDVTICDGDSTTLTATGGDSYLWSTGETTQSITVNPIATSNYTVIVSNDFSSDTDEVLVTVNPLPNVQVTGDVTILQGEFVTLSATGANSYLWNNGATQPNIAVSPMQTITYSVNGYINNCFDTAEVEVTVVEPVNAYAGPDETICWGDSITLTASGGDNYLWNTGETTQSISVSPEENTTYTVIVSNELDSDAAEVNVSVEDCEIEIPTDDADYEYSVYMEKYNSSILVVKLAGLEDMSELSIHDLKGKLLYFERVLDNDGQPQEIRINTSQYSEGVYIITLQEKYQVTPKQVMFR